MGPEAHVVIARVAREAHAGVEQALAEAEAARLGDQKEEAQLGDAGLTRLDAEDRAEAGAALLGDEGAFGGGVVAADEIGEDFGDQRLEGFVEAFITGVENPMLFDQPACIADLQVSQNEGVLHTRTVVPGGVTATRPCDTGGGALGAKSTCGGPVMGINSESEMSANLQIGPTTMGMVRIYVEGEGIDLPMDFDPDEAEEIAEEIRAAAARARAMAQKGGKGR